jgi:ComF family protein
MGRVLPQVAKLGETALNLFFPKRCVGCGKEGYFICAACRITIPAIMPPVCPLCGKPQASGLLCPGCTGWQSEIDGIRSPFRFDGVIRQAVYQLKYRNLRALAPVLAGLLQNYMITYPVPGDLLVPVPLHKKRIRERGYNQSGLVAKELSKLSGMPVDDKSLVRAVYSSPQARTTNVDERRTNVSGAFRCYDNKLSGTKVILIDDVSTSGATLNACAAALKEAGVESVWGLTLAKEI